MWLMVKVQDSNTLLLDIKNTSIPFRERLRLLDSVVAAIKSNNTAVARLVMTMIFVLK